MPLHLPKMVSACVKGTTLAVQGHAGAAPYGQDLVCAAVTGLVYALAQRLTELEQEGAFKGSALIKLTSGEAQISVIPREQYISQVQENFDLIRSGLTLLQHHYPNQIKVN